MTIPAAILSAEQARAVRDNDPTFGDRQGIDLPRLLNDFAAAVKTDVEASTTDLADILSGTATILNATTSIAVVVGAAYNGKRAVVSFAEAPVAAAKIWAAPVSGGNLTIAIDVNNTADVDVHYVLDGR
jgi:hypothetical protein